MTSGAQSPISSPSTAPPRLRCPAQRQPQPFPPTSAGNLLIIRRSKNNTILAPQYSIRHRPPWLPDTSRCSSRCAGTLSACILIICHEPPGLSTSELAAPQPHVQGAPPRQESRSTFQSSLRIVLTRSHPVTIVTSQRSCFPSPKSPTCAPHSSPPWGSCHLPLISSHLRRGRGGSAVTCSFRQCRLLVDRESTHEVLRYSSSLQPLPACRSQPSRPLPPRGHGEDPY